MIRTSVNALVSVIDKLYRGRPFPRFYILETLACMPYYAHLSVLNFYENLGFWRQVDWLKVHFSESWNDAHHLLIMEVLEGDKYWYDRLFARAIAVVCYWVLVCIYIVNPYSIYRFIELVARHAYADYGRFIEECKKELILRPAPQLVMEAYQAEDFSLFSEFQTNEHPSSITNLLELFSAIRDQEMERIKMMLACQESNAKVEEKIPHRLARP